MAGKRIFLIFPALIFFLVNGIGQTKQALIFAIGNYPKAGGWPALSSIRDVGVIRQALLRQGFQEGHIKAVTDEAATVKGISGALAALVEAVKPGDVVVIHFSAHGEQVEDDNNDEIDGYDECIVTYNAILPERSKNFDKDKNQYYRDDELGKYIVALRRKLGRSGDVIVFMNLCHSGSGTRGLATIRGGQLPFVSPNFHPANLADRDTADRYAECNKAIADPRALASYVVYSAAEDDEMDYEVTDENNMGMGSLTYAMCRSLESLSPGSTYRSLFSRIKAVMVTKVPNQHPVLEGNGIDREIFGGKLTEQKPYAEILSLKGNSITLNAGRFAGLDAGATIAMYPSGTKDLGAAAALSTGTIVKAGNYTAVATLSSPFRIANTAAYWFFVVQPVYKMPAVNIRFESGSGHPATGFTDAEIGRIRTALRDMRTVQFEGAPQLLISKGPDADSIKIALSGYLYKTVKVDAEHPDDFKKVLQQYAQYQFLAGLEIANPAVTAQVRLIPYVHGRADTGWLRHKLVNGSYVFTESDSIVIWARNPGTVPVYINILDLQPDGGINPVFPNKKYSIYAQDLKIEPRRSRLFDAYPLVIEKPYGTEIFKVFVSSREIDLEKITESRSDLRGSASVLERLVKTSYRAVESGTENHTASNADGSTFSILFRIVP